MLSFKNILFFASAVSALALPELVERDGKANLQRFASINSHTVAFTQKVRNYAGGQTVLDLVQAQNQLNGEIKSSTTTAQNGGAVTASEAQSIIDYINNTLEPNIKNAMAAMKSKKALFQKNGYGKVALSGLQDTKSNTDKLGAALLNITPREKKSSAKATQAKIDADFNGAISFYSS